MRRSTRITRSALALLGVITLALTATACAEEDTTALRQIQPGQTVFIRGYDQDADKGDRAQVEQKPSNLWVIPEETEFRTTKQGDFKVEVTLDDKGQWHIVQLNGVRTGYDHDNCLSNEEQYAVMDDKNPVVDNGEQKHDGDTSNDDCAKGGDVPAEQ